MSIFNHDDFSFLLTFSCRGLDAFCDVCIYLLCYPACSFGQVHNL